MSKEMTMNHGYGGNHANSYLAQRISNASPEELAGMLLGGAERFLTQAAAAVRSENHKEKARLLSRTSQIMQRLLAMLNPEADRQLVNRLHGIYIWWIKEMFEGSRRNRPEQIELVVRQMAALRGGWEELGTRRVKAQAIAPLSVEGLVG
jgi:flagellar biosynthetic protein FliS